MSEGSTGGKSRGRFINMRIKQAKLAPILIANVVSKLRTDISFVPKMKSKKEFAPMAGQTSHVFCPAEK